jgi:hypothetical protein
LPLKKKAQSDKDCAFFNSMAIAARVSVRAIFHAPATTYFVPLRAVPAGWLFG